MFHVVSWILTITMDFEFLNGYMKASFAACLFSLVLARMELNPVSASPDEIATQGLPEGDRKGYPGFAAASKSCYDRKGHLVPEGHTFTPPGHDGCTQCTCLHGAPTICSIVRCAAPTCSNFENIPDECCQYTCLDNDPNVPNNNDPNESNLPWCPDGWYLYSQTNSCFRKPQKYNTLKHTAAQEFCRHEGGSLATVTGQELQDVLTKQAIDPSNSTLVWWMGYMLVPSVSGDVDKGVGSSGSNSNNTTTTMWQVQTEEQTGPEPLVDNSANIPTTVPEDLNGQPVVCIQLKLVYIEGFLKKWGWNLAQCDESVPFICKKTASKSCYDRKGNLVPEGQTFTPPGHDGCTQCTCLHGVPNICSIAGCAPPTCSKFENNPDECCQYTCLDSDSNVPNNNDPTEPIMSENMRWVLTMITSFLLLGMMLFMVYRMRQKRIAYLRYRVQQLRDTQEGEFEPGSGPPPVPALDDLDGAIFREPPPPYSFFKDCNRIEMPPPYNVQQNASQRIGRSEVNHNRDSRGSDQPDNVRLLPGSEPTTPSDISTISTLASPPPYNRCQSTDSMPMTPPETSPMLPTLDTTPRATPQQSSSTRSTMPTRSPTRSSMRSPTRSSMRSPTRSSLRSPVQSPTVVRNTTV